MRKEIRRTILLLLVCLVPPGCALTAFDPCVVPAPPRVGEARPPVVKPDRKGLHVASIDEMLKLPDEEIDIGKGALLIAREYDPEIDVKKYLGRLDEMARELREKLGEEKDPEKKVAKVNRYLFVDRKYTYACKAEHTFLHSTMDAGVGSCAGLSALYWALGERTGMPLGGVLVIGRQLHRGGTPAGHVFLQYRTDAALIGIDPAAEGRRLPEWFYRLRLLALDRGALRQISKRQFLGVLFSNYSLAYRMQGRYPQAVEAAGKAAAIVPGFPFGWENLYTAHGMKHDYASCLEVLHRCEMLGGTATHRALSSVQKRVAEGAGMFTRWAPTRPPGKILILPPSFGPHVSDPEAKRTGIDEIARNTFSSCGWRPIETNRMPPMALAPHEIADLGKRAGADAVCTLEFARYDGSGIGFSGETFGFEGRIFYVMRLYDASSGRTDGPATESPRVLKESRLSVRSGLSRLDEIFAKDLASVAAASLWRDSRDLRGLGVKTTDSVLDLAEEEIDMATAALVIAKSVNRNIDIAAYRDRIDAIAASLSCRVSGAKSVREKIEILGDCVSSRYKCTPRRNGGNRLDAVLDNGCGAPLGLAVACLAVAERLGIPLVLTTSDEDDVALRYHWRDGAFRLDVRGRLTAFNAREQLAADPTTLRKRQVIALLFAAAGNEMVEKKEFTSAHRLFRKALALAPRCAEAWCGQGAAYDRRGQLHKSIEAYGKALEIKPEYADAWNGLVLATCRKGDYAGAWERVHKARTLDVKIDRDVLEKLRAKVNEAKE